MYVIDGGVVSRFGAVPTTFTARLTHLRKLAIQFGLYVS